jgi:hypothetical protein
MAEAPTTVAMCEKQQQAPQGKPALHRTSFPYSRCYCEENIYCFLRKMRLMQVMEARKLAANPELARNNNPSLLVASLFDHMFAVFVSGLQIAEESEVACTWDSSRIVVCTHDLASTRLPRQDPFVLWDYHVVAFLRRKEDRSWYVVDFDSSVAPVGGGDGSSEGGDNWIDSDLLIPFERYFSASFFPVEQRDGKFTRQNVKLLSLKAAENVFRLIPCDEYLCTLRSDRSHMLLPPSGSRSAAGRGGDGVSASAVAPPQYSQPPPPYPPIGSASDALLDAIFGDKGQVATTRQSEGDAAAAAQAVHKFTKSKHARIVGNNLVCFINSKNKTMPGTVVRRDEVRALLASK